MGACPSLTRSPGQGPLRLALTWPGLLAPALMAAFERHGLPLTVDLLREAVGLI